MRKHSRKHTTNEDPQPPRFGFGWMLVIGVVTVVVVLLLLSIFDPLKLLKRGESLTAEQQVRQQVIERLASEEEQMNNFISAILGDTQYVWNDIFLDANSTYHAPTPVYFEGEVRGACDQKDIVMGPYYCRKDRKMYFDKSFFRDLRNLQNAPGDLAQAYVIAHEVGHHVQNLIGIDETVRKLQRRMSKAESERYDVLLELQADFLAGWWANHATRLRSILRADDIEAALDAVTAMGESRVSRQTRGFITPDPFTHATKEERVRWFKRGFETGDLTKGDTFEGALRGKALE